MLLELLIVNDELLSRFLRFQFFIYLSRSSLCTDPKSKTSLESDRKYNGPSRQPVILAGLGQRRGWVSDLRMGCRCARWNSTDGLVSIGNACEESTGVYLVDDLLTIYTLSTVSLRYDHLNDRFRLPVRILAWLYSHVNLWYDPRPKDVDSARKRP